MKRRTTKPLYWLGLVCLVGVLSSCERDTPVPPEPAPPVRKDEPSKPDDNGGKKPDKGDEEGKEKPQEAPQLPVQIFTNIGSSLEELRQFEAEQKNRQVAARIPERVETDEIWVAVSYIKDNDGQLAPCHTVAYSGRGNSLSRVNLFMQSRKVYDTLVSPWVDYHYRHIGTSQDGRAVYEPKAISQPKGEDILLAVSLIDNEAQPKKSEYKLLWIQRQDINLK